MAKTKRAGKLKTPANKLLEVENKAADPEAERIAASGKAARGGKRRGSK